MAKTLQKCSNLEQFVSFFISSIESKGG